LLLSQEDIGFEDCKNRLRHDIGAVQDDSFSVNKEESLRQYAELIENKSHLLGYVPRSDFAEDIVLRQALEKFAVAEEFLRILKARRDKGQSSSLLSCWPYA